MQVMTALGSTQVPLLKQKTLNWCLSEDIKLQECFTLTLTLIHSTLFIAQPYAVGVMVMHTCNITLIHSTLQTSLLTLICSLLTVAQYCNDGRILHRHVG